jgi:hypothetical protein
MRVIGFPLAHASGTRMLKRRYPIPYPISKAGLITRRKTAEKSQFCTFRFPGSFRSEVECG